MPANRTQRRWFSHICGTSHNCVARAGLRPLDLGALQGHDGGPPSELQARRSKFAQYEQQCSEVAPNLYVSGEAVAKSWELLQSAGITHIINCAGQVYPAYFHDDLLYHTLHLAGMSC